MALRFGTSGVRGLVTEMTDRECSLFVRAFARHLKNQDLEGTVAVGGDLRESTPRILRAVTRALEQENFEAEYCGQVPTPTLAYYGLCRKIPSIMVTGSHIPADRNGIKFNMPWGEILKPDEGEITRLYRHLSEEIDDSHLFDSRGAFLIEQRPDLPNLNSDAIDLFLRRYLDFFPPNALEGRTVLLWEHSSVGRDLLVQLLQELGADLVRVGRSDRFVAVDTEAVENLEQLRTWVHEYDADALVSTDGDADRPLLVDDTGSMVRGDLLGLLVAESLGADSISIPVSCNTAAERSGAFDEVRRTRIGSPFVIESMLQACEEGFERVVGYEANGGFLTSSPIPAKGTKATLAPLPTRDSVLPLLQILCLSRSSRQEISLLVSTLPDRYTFSGVLREFPRTRGQEAIRYLEEEGLGGVEEYFSEVFGPPAGMDFTDGARILFESGEIVHFRPSGNAPEFRCYTESDSPGRARQNNEEALRILQEHFLRPK